MEKKKANNEGKLFCPCVDVKAAPTCAEARGKGGVNRAREPGGFGLACDNLRDRSETSCQPESPKVF